MWPYLEERVSEDIIKDLEMRLSWISWWPLNPMTDILKRDKRGKYAKKKRRQCDDGSRDWSDVATKNKMPADTRRCKRQGLP